MVTAGKAWILTSSDRVYTFAEGYAREFITYFIIISEDWAVVVVSKIKQQLLIKEMHEGPGGGHFSVARVQRKIEQLLLAKSCQ